MITVLFLLFILSFIILTVSPLHFSILLISFSSLVVYHLVSFSHIPALIGLLILLVYLGAIIILLAYVCAVTPNLYFGSSVSITKFVLFLLSSLLFLCVNFCFFSSFSSSFSMSFSLPSFFYSCYGALSFFFVIIMMLVVMFVVSTSSQVRSPIRSVS